MGPIGVDNSELINIEIEDEYKAKQAYIEHLMGGKGKGFSSDQSDLKDDKENMNNERLLARLTNAAASA